MFVKAKSFRPIQVALETAYGDTETSAWFVKVHVSDAGAWRLTLTENFTRFWEQVIDDQHVLHAILRKELAKLDKSSYPSVIERLVEVIRGERQAKIDLEFIDGGSKATLAVTINIGSMPLKWCSELTAVKDITRLLMDQVVNPLASICLSQQDTITKLQAEIARRDLIIENLCAGLYNRKIESLNRFDANGNMTEQTMAQSGKKNAVCAAMGNDKLFSVLDMLASIEAGEKPDLNKTQSQSANNDSNTLTQKEESQSSVPEYSAHPSSAGSDIPASQLLKASQNDEDASAKHAHSTQSSSSSLFPVVDEPAEKETDSVVDRIQDVQPIELVPPVKPQSYVASVAGTSKKIKGKRKLA